MNNINSDIFQEELSWIKNPLIQQFAIAAINMLPDYFFYVAASSTGKYHPSYALGPGGLVRHTKAATKIAHELLGLDMYSRAYKPDEKDLMIVALILHDGWKHGSGSTPSDYTVSTHPTVCANWIRETDALSMLLPSDQIDFLCGCIESHMGQWNTDYRTKRQILPIPKTSAQKFVHQADYLASRKYLLFDFGDEYYNPPHDNADADCEHKDSNLNDAISCIVSMCKKMIDAGIERHKIYEIISANNNGNRNPNSITSVEIASKIQRMLEELNDHI